MGQTSVAQSEANAGAVQRCDGALQSVGIADEICHEDARRTVVQLPRRRQLLDHAMVHHHYAHVWQQAVNGGFAQAA